MFLTLLSPQGDVPPPPPVETGARGGYVPYKKGEKRARGLEWDRKEINWAAELREIYAELHGELKHVAPVAEVRAAVTEHAAPSDAPMPPIAAIDFAALAADLAAVKALYAAYERALQEQDDEEALLLLA
jgi:hypothetical protein